VVPAKGLGADLQGLGSIQQCDMTMKRSIVHLSDFNIWTEDMPVTLRSVNHLSVYLRKTIISPERMIVLDMRSSCPSEPKPKGYIRIRISGRQTGRQLLPS
jgi:hypothetical protein